VIPVSLSSARYLCEVRAGQYGRLERLKSFDEFLEARYGLYARQVTYDPLHQRLRPLRFLHRLSDCFRVERTQFPGGTFTRNRPTPFHGARVIASYISYRSEGLRESRAICFCNGIKQSGTHCKL